jgi:hypothetical protein
MRYKWGFLNGSGSFYTVGGKNQVPAYEVPGRENLLLGMPTFKFTVNSGFKVYRELTVAPSLVVFSTAYAFEEAGMDGNGILRAHGPLALANLFLHWPNLLAKGVELGAGVHNLLDADYDFIQPYNAGHPPLPGPSREVFVRVAYSVGL